MGEASKRLQGVVRGLIKTAQIFTSYTLSEAFDFEGFESRSGIDRRASQRASISREWGAAEIDLVLKIRHENPTYGKAKIVVTVIFKLKRDHNFRFSESAVGRILNYLKDKGKITKSMNIDLMQA